LSLGKRVQIGRGVRFKIIGSGKVRIEDGAALEDHVYIQAEDGTVVIGPDAFIGAGSQVVAMERVTIGRDALVAAYCVIRDADHRFSDPATPIRLQGHVARPIEIGADVWLGAHVVVTAGSTIGDGCVIGANAVVRGEIPAQSIAVGVPAKVIKKRAD